MERELEIILAQQKELEELLTPLEKEVLTNHARATQGADRERRRIYELAEGLDDQMQQISTELAEVIDHVNAVNEAVDPSNAVTQVAKILNAHAESLQWIEQNSGALRQQLSQLSILMEEHKLHRISK